MIGLGLIVLVVTVPILPDLIALGETLPRLVPEVPIPEELKDEP